jgi:ribosome-associated translation inhibitor RaiA
MQIKTKTTDYEMTAEVETYLAEKLAAAQKLVKDDPYALCDVTIGRASAHSKHGEVWFAEFDFVPTTGERMHTYARAETINAAIDKAKDELLQQLRRNKKFHVKMLRKGGAAIKKMMRWE